MDENNTTDVEVPLSNREVLKVLKARNEEPDSKCSDMITYLESIIKEFDKYPLEILRDFKVEAGLDATLNTLAILSNTNELSILSPSDRKRIIKKFN